ncbi:MAG: hypothetical protein OHK0012_00540 [Synechococcales cyanobacterium]
MTHYTLRHILRTLEVPVTPVFPPGVAQPATPSSDLNQVLTSLYLDEHHIGQSIRKLEALVTIYKRMQNEPTALAKIKQEILWILGLKVQAPVQVAV